MTEELRNKIWETLPKEYRDEVKAIYTSHTARQNITSQDTLLDKLFGKLNLTSDEEPSELLFVEREKVIEAYKHYNAISEDNNRPKDYTASYYDEADGIVVILDDLFGDKCLPDKEPSVQGEPKKFFESDFSVGDMVIVYISSIGKPRKEVVTLIRQYQPQCEYNDYAKTWVIQTQDGQTFQANEEHFEPYTEPKFKIGDKVRYISQNHEIGEIAAYWPNEKFCYSVRFGKEYHNMAEHQLEPYTEPKFKVGDKVVIATKPYDIWWDGIVKTIKNIELNGDGIYIYSFYDYNYNVEEYDLYPYTESETKSFKVGDRVRVKGDTKVREVYRVLPDGKVIFGDKGSTHLAINLELVEPETKDNSNMEEKELNLVELLKGCEGERVYSLMFGEVTFERIIAESNLSVGEKPIVTSSCRYLPNAMYGLDGVPTLFPSRALYEKYPLDVKKAWDEWKSERTPNRWRAEKWKPYWYLDRRLISKECTADVNSDFDRTNYKNGNMFRTEEEAQQASEAVRECLGKFHEKNSSQNLHNPK